MSSELELIREWYAYNSYVRKRYYRVLAKLPETELTRDRGASFPSLLDIFVHTLDAYRWWFVFVYPDRLHKYKRLRGSGLTLRDAKKEEQKIDTFVRNFLLKLIPSDLSSTVTWHDITRSGKRSKKRQKAKLRDLIWHVVEEELQHRGEMNALLWQSDVDPPITGWEPLPQEAPGWSKFKSKYLNPEQKMS